MRQELSLLKEYSIILWKETIEYKINLYMYLLTGLSGVVSIVIYAFFLTNAVSVQEDEFQLFVLTLFFIFIIGNIVMLTWAKPSLFRVIQNGALNTYLKFPTNTFFQYYSHLQTNPLIFIAINCILFSYFIFTYDIQIVVWISLVLTSIIISIFGIGMGLFVDSLSWILYTFTTNVEQMYGNVNRIFVFYPASFFEKFPIPLLLTISYSYYVILLIVPQIEQNRVILSPTHLGVLGAGIILMILSYYIWQRGLKKYEAFG